MNTKKTSLDILLKLEENLEYLKKELSLGVDLKSSMRDYDIFLGQINI